MTRMPDGAPAPHLDGTKLALTTAVTAAAALAAVVLFVLPSEYGVDPTGFGDATGLTELAAPPEVVVETRLTAPVEIASRPVTPFREDTVTLTVGGMMENWGQVEYKLSMLAGDDMVYRWTASAPIYFEFHGHTIPTEEEPMQVMDYIADQSTESQGRLTAPVDGVHGWFFRNEGFEPIEITFHFAGFYTLEPGVIEFVRQ
ncbi:MAG: hypothetical protein KDK53_13075 [Maritimibacter sp.]|nr:hypothetical protein [Maritimibacter sp.]